MSVQLSGASRLFPIIGDPIIYVESPASLTRTLTERGHEGVCVPMQVADGDLDAVMAELETFARERPELFADLNSTGAHEA